MTEGGPAYRIPPTTPEYPGGKYEMYDGPGKKPVSITAYVNGWCAIVWLVRTDPGKGGSPLAPPISALPKPFNDPKLARLVSDPPQPSVDTVAKHMKEANKILAACKVALRVCEVNILDARRLSWTKSGKPFTLADSFTNGVAVVEKSSGGSSDFFDTLQAILSNGSADGESRPGGQTIQGADVFKEFVDKLKKPCFHIFLLQGVKNKDNPNANAMGVTTKINFGASIDGKPTTSPISLVTTQDKEIGSTLAHEIGHGLGLKHAEDDADADVKGDANNLMKATPAGTSLKPSQCKTMEESLKMIAPACP